MPVARNRHRLLWLLPALALIAALAPLTTATAAPADPTGNSAATFRDARPPHDDAIKALAAEGVTNGCDTDRYCPDDAVTRIQLAALLVRALDLPAASGHDFPDVPRDHVLAGEVAAAADAGIVQGQADGNFRPGAPVTRAQSATMLSRALALEEGEGPSFRDTIGSTHEPAVESLVAAGISAGCGDGFFCPATSLTRGQAASLIARGVGYIEPIPTDLRPTQLPPEERTPASESRSAPTGSREDLLAQREGFGRNAGSGSGDWSEVVVTTLSDSGSGSLRDALAGGNRWIRFADGLAGTIRVGSKLNVPSNVVIDGRGADITLSADSSTEILALTGVDNVIVSNLKLEGGYDGIQIFQGTTNVWIHQITSSAAADEMIAITGDGQRPDLITVSWSRFNDGGKVMLLSGSEYDANHAADRVTLHHNVFYRSLQRQPLVRFSRVHFYNNWVYQWGAPGTGQAVRVGNDGQFASESNIFDDVHGRPAMIPEDLGTYGYIRSENDLTTGNPEIQEREPGRVFDPASQYDYRVDAPGDSLREALSAGAGWQAP
ncbi:MAG TPA: S-layer homology domain-containing protein [Egicoccus sp.]|nr:S-layer homology domain-containing protein [Egicoccus sp.]HSK22579.1 S-layer homology domain-containing protein [Egicoccus sp.]